MTEIDTVSSAAGGRFDDESVQLMEKNRKQIPEVFASSLVAVALRNTFSSHLERKALDSEDSPHQQHSQITHS